MIKNGERPNIKEPTDIKEEDLKVKWKVRIWEGEVDRYSERISALEDKMKALFSGLINNVSALTKSKIASVIGYTTAKSDMDPI